VRKIQGLSRPGAVVVIRTSLSAAERAVKRGPTDAGAWERLGRLRLRIDPTITLNRLPISKQQMVEIAKSLSFDSEVLIMDEPTSALTESEIDELFSVIHTLRDRGVAIIYISHRLEELKHIVDRISIFRDGRHVSTDDYAAITMEEIVNRMAHLRHFEK